MSKDGNVELSISNNIGTIEFSHPKGNSLPGAILRKLATTIDEAGKNSEVKVIVVKSSGEGAFCAGASFDELVAIEDFETGKKFFMGFALVLNAMRQSPKLIIVRVHGKTVGGGVGIASAGDYTFAKKGASVKLSELALGIGPFVVGPAVERSVGTSAFSTMAVDATNWYDSTWATQKGLFNKEFDTTEELDQAVSDLANQLAKSSPEAMNELKKYFGKALKTGQNFLDQRAEVSGRLVLSDYTKNFIKKFKAK